MLVTLARVKILVIGSGGREHAIIRRLAADRPAPELHAAPGNPGIAQLATLSGVLGLSRSRENRRRNSLSVVTTCAVAASMA